MSANFYSSERSGISIARSRLYEVGAFCGVVAILATVVANIYRSTHQTKTAVALRGHLALETEEVLERMGSALAGATVLARPADSPRDPGPVEDWFGLFDWPGGPRPIRFACLPRLSTTKPFAKEFSPGSRTGNVLLLARLARAVVARAEDLRERELATLRFECIYPTRGQGTDGRRTAATENLPYKLDLARFVSIRCVDLQAARKHGDPLRVRGLLRTVAKGLEPVLWAWDRTEPLAQSLYRIDPDTGVLTQDRGLPVDPQASQPQVLSAELALAGNTLGTRAGVAALGQLSTLRGGFPHGFELQLAGSAASRRVVLHLTLTTAQPVRPPASVDLRNVVLVQEN